MQAAEEKAAVGKAPGVASRFRLRRLLFVVGAVCVAAGVILSLLPYAIEQGAVAWLRRHGVEDARIDNVDLNLFSGEATIEGLKSGDGLNIDHLSLVFDWLALRHHIVHVRTLELNESSLHLLEHQGIWQVAGIKAAMPAASDTDIAADQQSEPWQLVVDDLQMEDVKVRVETGVFKLSVPLKSLRLSLSPPLQQAQQMQQRMVNSIEIGDTSFSGFGYSVQVTGAKIAGEVTLSLLSKDILAADRRNKLALDLQGVKIRSTHDKRRITAAALKFDGVELSENGHIRIASAGLDHIRIEHTLNGQGDVKLDDVVISGLNAYSDGAISVAKLALKGVSAKGVDGHRQALRIADIAMAGLETGDGGSVSVAEVALQQLKAKGVSSAHHVLHLASAKLSGLALRGGKQIQLKSLHLQKGNLYAQDTPTGSAPGRLLGAFDQADLDQFIMNGPDSGSFESFQLARVQLPTVLLSAAGNRSLGSVGLIRVSKARLGKDGSYHVEQLKMDQLQAQMVKQKSGWLLPPEMRADKSANRLMKKAVAKSDSAKHKGNSTQAAVRHPATQATKSRLVIDEVVVGAGSRMALRDESVTPTLTTTLQLEQFRFAPLDSAGRQDGKLVLKAKMDQSGSLRASGTLTPAAGDRLRADLHVSLHNIGLPRLSGYVENDLGRSIKTGQLNLDSDISIGHNRLQSKNKLLIRKLQLDAPTHPENVNQHPDLAGGMSIDMALGMLQDDRGDIALNVPVNGPLDDPDVNLDHIINKALLVSLKTGAMTYAALALQPYGSIILIADVAGGLLKNAAKPTLTPIRFGERQKTLSAQMKAYVGKIAALMQKKDFRLQVCGVATRIEGEVVMQPSVASPEQQAVPNASVDLPALNDAQLLALAQARSDLVVAALHGQGIAANRLFNCSPAIDKAKIKAEPRVELLLD